MVETFLAHGGLHTLGSSQTKVQGHGVELICMPLRHLAVHSCVQRIRHVEMLDGAAQHLCRIPVAGGDGVGRPPATAILPGAATTPTAPASNRRSW